MYIRIILYCLFFIYHAGNSTNELLDIWSEALKEPVINVPGVYRCVYQLLFLFFFIVFFNFWQLRFDIVKALCCFAHNSHDNYLSSFFLNYPQRCMCRIGSVRSRRVCHNEQW